jgi:hypothetical protein
MVGSFDMETSFASRGVARCSSKSVRHCDRTLPRCTESELVRVIRNAGHPAELPNASACLSESLGPRP